MTAGIRKAPFRRPVMEPLIYGSYRVAYAETVPLSERANFGVIVYGENHPPEYRVLQDWARFTAFTGYTREDCEPWLRGWATDDGLASYALGEQRGSTGQVMSVFKLTGPLATALNAEGESIDRIADHFLLEHTPNHETETP